MYAKMRTLTSIKKLKKW